MKRTKRCLIICGIAIIVIILGCMGYVYIGSDDIAESIGCSDKSGIDEYAELLLPIKPSDEFYTDYNEYVRSDTDYQTAVRFDKDSEIARYNDSGYMSFTVHLNGAYTLFDSKNKYTSYWADNYEAINYKTAKIAFVDKDGNIENITNEVQIVRHSLWGAPWGVDLVYENGKLTSEFFYNKPMFAIGMMFIIFVLPALGLSYIAVIITLVIDISKGT